MAEWIRHSWINCFFCFFDHQSDVWRLAIKRNLKSVTVVYSSCFIFAYTFSFSNWGLTGIGHKALIQSSCSFQVGWDWSYFSSRLEAVQAKTSSQDFDFIPYWTAEFGIFIESFTFHNPTNLFFSLLGSFKFVPKSPSARVWNRVKEQKKG